MTAPKIQADYAQLASMASIFAQEANHTQQQVSILQSGDWTGLGAHQFFQEMGDLVFPAIGRLRSALADAGEAAQKIAAIFEEAEQVAGQLFGGGDGGFESTSGGAGGGVTTSGGTAASVATASTSGGFFASLFGNKYFVPGGTGAIPTSHWDRNTAYVEMTDTVKGLPGMAKDVKFFSAAERVTSSRMLGGTSFTPDFVVSQTAFNFTNKVGEDLYTFNKMNAEKLVVDPNNLYDPNGTGRRMASALEYDVNYVHAEQSRVESWIRSESAAGRLNSDHIGELSDALNGGSSTSVARDLFYKGVSPVADTGASDWAKSYVGGSLDFNNQAHREAIGKATVFQAHGLSYSDYQTYMRTGKLP